MSDGLTGIANRRCFDQRLAADWARLAREGRPLALLLVDADSFKPLNDACGHLYGDECLRELARICAQFADGERRPGRALRRRGTGAAAARPRPAGQRVRIGERLRRQVEAAAMPHPSSAVAPHVTVSIGVSALQPAMPRSRRSSLIDAADRALYAAKARRPQSRGRSRRRLAAGSPLVGTAGP